MRTTKVLVIHQKLGLEHCDIAVAPTEWQKRLHPKAYRDKIHVIHERSNTDVSHAARSDGRQRTRYLSSAH